MDEQEVAGALPVDPDGTFFLPSGLREASLWWERSQQEWLATIPSRVAFYEGAWAIRVGRAFSPGGSAAFVAPATRADGSPAVFKLAPPLPDVQHEGAALQLYDGEGAVRVYAGDPPHRALLLEACRPGTPLLEAIAEPRAQFLLAAPLLRRLWRPVPSTHPFAVLHEVAARWAGEIEQYLSTVPPPWEPGLLQLGANLLRTLPLEATRTVLLHRDFHLGNVLAAQREPWLVIDPQPLVGDPTFDAVQLVVEPGDILAGPDPLHALQDRLALVAVELELDAWRLCAWAVARSVAWAMDSLTVGAPSWGAEAIQMAGLLRRLLG